MFIWLCDWRQLNGFTNFPKQAQTKQTKQNKKTTKTKQNKKLHPQA